MFTSMIEITEADLLEQEGGGNVFEATIIRAGFGNKVNNHYYSASLLEREAAKFVGAQMFADHEMPAAALRRGGVRSVNDLVGVVQEAWYDEASKSIRGKVELLRGWILEIAQRNPNVLKLSIAARAKVNRGLVEGRSANIVESVEEVGSVDVVTRAGAGGIIDRLIESNMEDDMLDTLTIEDIKEHRSDLITAIIEAEAEKLAVDKVAIAEEAVAAATENGDILTKEAHEAAVAAAKEESRAEIEAELAERAKAEAEEAAAKEEAAAVVAECLAESGLPEKSKESIARLMESMSFMESEGDDGAVISATEQLREAAEAVIAERREELAEAAGGNIKDMGASAAGLGSPKAPSAHDQAMRLLGLND